MPGHRLKFIDNTVLAHVMCCPCPLKACFEQNVGHENHLRGRVAPLLFIGRGGRTSSLSPLTSSRRGKGGGTTDIVSPGKGGREEAEASEWRWGARGAAMGMGCAVGATIMG